MAQILVNCANAYDKKEVEPELVELAKFAKHHVPEDHEKVVCQLLFYQLLINAMAAAASKEDIILHYTCMYMYGTRSLCVS